jgi:hypothetical protein
MKSKSVLSKYKPLYDYGRTFAEVNPNISYTVQNFTITQVYEEFKRNKDAFTESDKKEFESMVKELAMFKKSGSEIREVNDSEYLEFLENLFANVDDEDRYGEVTLKTSATFKMIGELIDVLGKWGDVANEWQQRSKFVY